MSKLRLTNLNGVATNSVYEHAEELICLGQLTISPVKYEVRVHKQRINLSLTEFRILQVLASRPGWVFSRSQIFAAAHGAHSTGTERSVDAHVMRLRRKLLACGKLLETVRSVGYRMAIPEENLQ